MLDLTAALEKKKVQIISKKENIDTSTAAGKFMLAVFALWLNSNGITYWSVKPRESP
nr:hypothetical protein [uncultured Oscillibacter sp.]